jgi:hypothetical protein
MAKIVKQTVLIELSQLVKDDAASNMDVVTQDLLDSLEAVTQELAGASVIVEVSEIKQ